MRKDKVATKKASKRGVTLVEITVVLAVVAVVSAMVSSYIALITQRLRSATATLEVMQDVAVITTITENFVDTAARNGVTLIPTGDVTENGAPTLEGVSNGGVAYLMKFEDGILTAQYPTETNEENTVTFKSDVIKNISFESYDSDLYYVRAEYEVPRSKNNVEEKVFTFSVNSYIGESV